MSKTAEIPTDQKEIRKELANVAMLKEEASPGIAEVLDKREAQLLNALTKQTKIQRENLEDTIMEEVEDESLRVRVVSADDYTKALQGRSSDPRIAKLQELAAKAGIDLQPGEVIAIKQVSGIDVSISESLSQKFQSELSKIGDNFVVLASRGSAGAGGTRGDLMVFEPGTRLRKTLKGVALEAEIVDNAQGERVVRASLGQSGTFKPGEEYNSLSGAAQAATGYNTNGTKFWSASAPVPHAVSQPTLLNGNGNGKAKS